MLVLDAVLTEELAALEGTRRRRVLRASARGGAATVKRGEREYISFSCNDYLGLSQHPAVKAAAIRAIEEYGAGAGASRLVTGNCPLYAELESLLAEMKGTEAACVFNSGYAANLGVISALMGKQDLVLFDRLAHASLIDGAMLSGAAWLRFKHNDTADCERLLAGARAAHRRCMVVTETVFSMDGDRAPIAALLEVARKYDAWLLTDDAHGFGIFNGSPASPPAHLQTGTLSKAVGAGGGYVCGSQPLVEYLHSAARPLVYSTGLPPAVIGAALAACRLMREEAELCAMPLRNAAFFCGLLGLPAPESAVVPLVMGDEARALDAAARLEEAGFLAAAIRPPTVPPGTSRLRFAFSALHREEDIERLAALIRVAGWCRR